MMQVTTKQVAMLGRSTSSKQFASLKVAQAAAGVEAAFGALGVALREDAQLRVNDTVHMMKRGLADSEVRVEALIARVPALGPWLAMALFRATHANLSEAELPIHPSNREEPSPNDAQTMLDYLECIGCHVA
jgi:hypothetical protein